MRRGEMIAVLVWGVLACDAGSVETATSVIAEESRYQVLLSVTSPPSPVASGELRIRVEMRNGWHIAPEAPARLELETPAGIGLSPGSLSSEDAIALDDAGVEWSAELRADKAGAATTQGHLKIGICEDDEERCVIVRRTLELPVQVFFAD